LSLIRRNHFSDGIYSAGEFQAVIQRERFRSDRSGSAFSLMVFTLRDSRSNKRDSLKIANVLTERVRSTDEVGWIGKKCLGVVLPDTPSEQARILAQDLQSRIGEGHVDGLRIYGYPWNGFGTFRKTDPSILAALRVGIGPGHSAISEQENGDSEEGIGHFLNCGSPRWKRVADILGAAFVFFSFSRWVWLLRH
jgi:hypothetical protein